MRHPRLAMALVVAVALVTAVGSPVGAKGGNPPPPPPPPPPSGPPAPALVAPADGASVLVPFTISWSAVSGPNGIVAYNWQVSPTANFASVIKIDSTMGPTQSTVSGLANGTYFWRVQAVDNSFNQGAWSVARRVVVTGAGPTSPGSPNLNPPKAGTQFHPLETITFTWSAVPGASSYIYDASTDPNFPVATMVHINNIPDTTYTLAFHGSLQGNWLARISAVDANGIAGVPSNTTAFSVFYNNPIGPGPTTIAPSGGVTVTLPVTLSWTEVANPQPSGYEAQIATDSRFANVEDQLSQLNDPSFTVLSLTAGQKFWRVRSHQGDSSPTTAAVTAWSPTATFTVTSAPPTVTGITLSRTAPFSGDPEDGLIQLSRAAPAGGSVVHFTSSDPSAAPVPATITVPAGFAVEQIHFQTGQVLASKSVTITATLDASSTSITITVQPPSLKELILSPGTITGGASTGGIVMLNGLAPPGGAVVNLTSNSPQVTPPASVTVAPGDASFSLSIPTQAVTANTTVTLTASWKGTVVQTPLTLLPQVPPATLVLDPTTTTGNSGSSGTVTIASPASTDTQILLSSSNTAIANLPPSVMVPAGSTAGGFLIFTQPPAASTTVTISASAGGVTKTATLTVNPFSSGPLPAPSLSSPSDASRVTAGSPVTFDWSDVAGASSYEIQVSTSQSFASSTIDQVVTPSQLSGASFTAASYFWRVRARDAAGSPGTWSTVRSFRAK